MAYTKKSSKAGYDRLRLAALTKISPCLKCNRCNCDDIRILEINHIAGGGRKERMATGFCFHKWLRSIRDGFEPVDKYELLCRPCNAIHALEMKYGPLPMKVIWN